MSGETDQTRPAPGDATGAEAPISTMGAEDEAQAAWDEFEAKDNGTEADPGDGNGGGSGQVASDSSGDPPSEPAEEDQSTEAGKGQGRSPAEEPAKGDPAGDIWANAPSELRSAFDALQSRADRAEHENASNRGRISALQNRIDSLLGAPEQQNRAGAASTSPAPGDSQDNAFEGEEWQQFRDDFGEIAGPIEKMFAAQASEIEAVKTENQRLRQGMKVVGEDRFIARSEQLESSVRQAHPDFDDIANSETFATWATRQPAYVQQAIVRNGENIVDAAEASDLIARYKADTGIGSPGANGGGSASGTGNGSDSNATAARARRRDIQLRSASGLPSGKGEPSRQEKEPESEEEAWDYWERRDAQEAARMGA